MNGHFHIRNLPIYQAAMVYQREPCARTFQEDLDIHLMTGYVYSTPEYFVMGRAVSSKAPESQIVDPRVPFPDDECDCWMVYLAAGDLTQLFKHDLVGYPYVCWEKRNKLKIYSLAAVKERVCFRSNAEDLKQETKI
jgi:hypothetical protein